MKKALYRLLLFGISIHWTVFAQNTTGSKISAQDIKTHISFLASDALKGRLTGTPECSEAASYIKSQFALFGLKPFPGTEWMQHYDFIADMAAENAQLSVSANGKAVTASSAQFHPAAFSGSGSFTGELVFAGYGISAPKLKYDDYENLDVSGKIVVVLRHHPEYNNPHSEFDEYASFRSKAAVAKEKGARAIIFVNGPLPKLDDDKLPEFKYDRAPSIKDFGVVFVQRALFEEVLTRDGLTLERLQDSISKGKKPLSFNLPGANVSLNIKIKAVQHQGENVIGYLEGTDPELKKQLVIIGAHFDHLGMGTDGSLYRGKDPMVHNGADDNASGTAGVLELAQKFAADKQNKRSILFVCFSGEELGLLGSGFYVNNPYTSAENVAAMINLDMVGRLNEEKNLIVYGTGTSTLWKTLLDSLNTPFGFKLTKNDEGYGPSDHSSFYGKNIPVLFFFTGTHEDYHRPSDDVEKINFPGEESVLLYVAGITEAIAGMQVKPDYVNVPRKGGEKSSGGWKVYVGTIPDYAYQGEGLKITGASEGSPAKKAGLQAGDIILKFGEKKIGNIYDYVYALKTLVPGDVVTTVVKRGDKEITTTITVGAK